MDSRPPSPFLVWPTRYPGWTLLVLLLVMLALALFVFVGAVVSSRLVWDFADIANGLMAIPNLVALLALHQVVVEETAKHRGVLTG